MRYIVLVRGVDDSYDAYGGFRDEEKAQRFADAFNRKVERFEEAHKANSDGEDIGSDIAWAYVMELCAPVAASRDLRSGVDFGRYL